MARATRKIALRHRVSRSERPLSPTPATATLESGPAASFFSGVYAWLVKVLGQFSIIYFRGLGLRIGVRVGVRVWVRVRVSVVLWSG